MRTLVDVAAFLKRNPGREIVISYNERQKRFEVMYDRTPSTSKYLEDAFEGLSETLRRRDSGTTLKTNEPAVPEWAKTTGSQHFGRARVNASCGTETAADGVCPDCNRLACLWSAKEFYCVSCLTGKTWSPTVGAVYAISGANYRYEGSAALPVWTSVS